MQQNNVSAVIIPGTDPHGSEYIADYWQEMNYISGFTGEAGTVVITSEHAALWTDSRYFLQAPPQIEPRGIELMREGVASTPTIAEWLSAVLDEGSIVSINPELFSVNSYMVLNDTLTTNGLILKTNGDYVGDVWTDRPALPNNMVFQMPRTIDGRTPGDKLKMVREEMEKAGIEAWLATSLDDIAWLCNLRGSDIAYNPVFMSYAIIEKEKATLFVDGSKVSDITAASIGRQGIAIKEYNDIRSSIAALDTRLGMDFSKANYSLYQAAQANCGAKHTPSPVTLMKAIKNNIELSGMRKAMIRDGVAMVKFLFWLEQQMQSSEITELDVVKRLHEFRAEQDCFVGESFATIAAYGPHAAIVHYEPTAETNIPLQPRGYLLLDSGGQYLDGTTDITRTIPLGPVSGESRMSYTMVFKGMVALANAKFPHGTRGAQLDVLARQYLWQHNKNYGHGTGHGVGHFLNVHEGPQSIRMQENPVILEPGMIMSDEPGYYQENSYGIRIENLISVASGREKNSTKFLHFDTLTLCPIDLKTLIRQYITPDEVEWINSYHQMVYKRLAPMLDKEHQKWLMRKCAKYV
ncbi:MAG: aminopeptidase P family protein [Paludibacteraceae bacterium]|nr:aminopeptidase P family protein [Paludibacteraceae bacterium]